MEDFSFLSKKYFASSDISATDKYYMESGQRFHTLNNVSEISSYKKVYTGEKPIQLVGTGALLKSITVGDGNQYFLFIVL